MRRGCQCTLMVLLLGGCAGPPAGMSSRTANDTSATSRATVAAPVGHLGAAEARGFLASHPEALVLDVRDPGEWDDDLGHIEGARQIPLAELPSRVAEVAAWRDRPVVVVCRVGVRSQRAAELLADAGYRQVVNLEGGMTAWRKSEKR
jgi:rhodanese-related sulfurtransferase